MVLPAQATLPHMEELRAALREALHASPTCALDASSVGAADMSFVQLVASASLTAAAAGGTFTLSGVPDAIHALFERAGLPIDRTTGALSAS